MVNDKNRNIASILQKHKPLSNQEIAENIKMHEEIKKNITTDATELEKNLVDFNNIQDVLIDPASNKPLCWVSRPTSKQLEDMIPSDLLKYKNSTEPLPEDVAKKYDDFEFQMMANLIMIPKHDANWWKSNSNLVFRSLFQKHLSGVLEDLGLLAENF